MSNKVACFIHSTNLELWKDEILLFLLDYLVSSDLIDLLDFIYVNNIGEPLNTEKIKSIHPKIIVENYSTDAELFEMPTLRSLHCFAKIHPNYKLLYLHTKGISRKKEEITKNPIQSWTNFMLYSTVDHCKDCLQLLNVYDVVGCNEISEFSDYSPRHYSGNFWWSNAAYFATLSVETMKDKHDAEFLLMKNNPCSFNVYSLYNMYESEYKVKNYSMMIQKRLEQDILFCKLDFFDQYPFHSLIQAITMSSVFPGHTIIVVDDIITDSNTQKLYDTKDKLDISTLNQRLSIYNIEIILKADIQMSVTKFMFGLKPYKEADITEKVISKFYHQNYFTIPLGFNLNNICEEDPMPNKRKHVYISFSINGRVFDRCYDEIMILYQRNHLLLDYKNYSNTPWLSSNCISSYLTSKKSFHLFSNMITTFN